MLPLQDSFMTTQGPLARVWLAAHWERKLSKTQFIQVNIQNSIGAIVGEQQQAPLALRVSGQLLLGVVRIYSRKARYLLEDCNEALVKLKMAFRTGVVDLPDEMTRAAPNAITLGDTATEFDMMLAEPEMAVGRWRAAPQPLLARAQDITMRESYFVPTTVDTWEQPSFDDPFMSSITPSTQEEAEVGLEFGDLFPEGMSMEVERLREAPSPRAFSPERVLGEVSLLASRRGSATVQLGLDTTMGLSFEDSLRISRQTVEVRQPSALFEEQPLEPREMGPGFEALGELPSIGELPMPTETSLLPAEGLEEETTVRGAPRRARRRPLVDEVTELSRQEISTPAVIDLASLLAQPPAVSDVMPTAQATLQDAASFYLQPPMQDLAPELSSMLDQARKRSEAEALTTPRAVKVPRIAEPATPFAEAFAHEPTEQMSTPLPPERPGVPEEPAEPLWEGELTFEEVEERTMSVSFVETGLAPQIEAMALRERPRPSSEVTGARRLFREEATAAVPPAEGEPVFSRTTRRAAEIIREQVGDIAEQRETTFRQLADSARRSDAARLFFELLVLGTRDCVQIRQDAPYADIHIRSKPALFEADLTMPASQPV